MKQNDWTQNLRSRLGERQASVPDDLWDKIESRLDKNAVQLKGDKNAIDTKPHAKRHISLVRYSAWAVSAAAAIALLVTIGYRANEETIERLADNRQGGGKESCANVVGQGLKQSVLADNSRVAADSRGVNGSGLKHVVKDSGTEPVVEDSGIESVALCDEAHGDMREVAETKVVERAQRDMEQETTETVGTSDNKGRSPQSNAHYALPRYAASGDESYSHSATGARWSVSAHTGGTFTDSRGSYSPAQRVLKTSSLATSDNPDAMGGDMMYVTNVALMSKYKEVKHHAQPVSLGLSMAYALTNRLSVTTGVVYTRALSDITKSVDGDDVVENQRLHYVGVPLGVKYNVWQNSSIQAYTTVGAQADFNVSASVTTGDLTDDINKDRPQFSVNAAAGLQVNVVPHVGVFAEPGVRYYFNNKSKVETIFKDTPWNFNLQLGLRLDF